MANNEFEDFLMDDFDNEDSSKEIKSKETVELFTADNFISEQSQKQVEQKVQDEDIQVISQEDLENENLVKNDQLSSNNKTDNKTAEGITSNNKQEAEGVNQSFESLWDKYFKKDNSGEIASKTKKETREEVHSKELSGLKVDVAPTVGMESKESVDNLSDLSDNKKDEMLTKQYLNKLSLNDLQQMQDVQKTNKQETVEEPKKNAQTNLDDDLDLSEFANTKERVQEQEKTKSKFADKMRNAFSSAVKKYKEKQHFSNKNKRALIMIGILAEIFVVGFVVATILIVK